MWNLVVLMLVMFVGPAYYVCCTLYRFLSEPSEPKPRIISNSTISNEKRISGEFKLVGHMCLDTEIEARAGVAVVLQDELPARLRVRAFLHPHRLLQQLVHSRAWLPHPPQQLRGARWFNQNWKERQEEAVQQFEPTHELLRAAWVLDDNCALNPGTTEGSTSWELPSPSPSARHTSMSSIHAETAPESCSSEKRAHEVPRCGPNDKLPGIPVGEDSARHSMSAMKVGVEGDDAADERALSGLHTLHQKA
eukprot:CAMPEP_0114320094 /NCGR_PEP_ID=MMETSP0059-20121206/25714_1 /TAXON_ID=36894 /ORGANISM="Pyramimonas parkeae, Strain CCMP726" /LENGTH=249 /DNA_ID=CAMNT_0001447391 /DNA_START=227 /DNA_END=974 /DNA_ORIENTATION=+